jgi:hypothetical protein
MAFLLITALPADDAYIVLEHRKMWDRVGLIAKTKRPLCPDFINRRRGVRTWSGRQGKRRALHDAPTALHPLRAS